MGREGGGVTKKVLGVAKECCRGVVMQEVTSTVEEGSEGDLVVNENV